MCAMNKIYEYPYGLPSMSKILPLGIDKPLAGLILLVSSGSCNISNRLRFWCGVSSGSHERKGNPHHSHANAPQTINHAGMEKLEKWVQRYHAIQHRVKNKKRGKCTSVLYVHARNQYQYLCGTFSAIIPRASEKAEKISSAIGWWLNKRGSIKLSCVGHSALTKPQIPTISHTAPVRLTERRISFGLLRSIK